MKRRMLLLAVTVLLSLALLAPGALAQDDDDDGVAAQPAPLPDTGGPALVVPVAGALLLGAGVAGFMALRRNYHDS